MDCDTCVVWFILQKQIYVLFLNVNFYEGHLYADLDTWLKV
jgi:hypothetical protein